MQFFVRTFVALFGLAFVVVGFIVGVGMAGEARSAAARAEALLPLTASQLDDQPPGQTVLVEGQLSPRNPARFRDFVAYVREEFRGTDSNGDEQWFEDERVTPPLLVEAAGLIRISNDTYVLDAPHARWQEEGLEWSSRTQEGTRRYRGLVASRPVLALGTVTRGAEGNELQAELVYGGTRAEYIAAQRSAARWLPWIGLFIGGAGLAVIFLGVWVLCTWRPNRYFTMRK